MREKIKNKTSKLDKRVERTFAPNEIEPQMDAEFDEKLVHLANIGRVSMRVEDGGGGHGVPDVYGHDLGAAARGQPQDLDVLAVRKGVQEQEPGGIVRNQLVGRWVRWKECKFGSHGRSHPTHYLALSLRLWKETQWQTDSPSNLFSFLCLVLSSVASSMKERVRDGESQRCV
jgi:hypothetical protein